MNTLRFSYSNTALFWVFDADRSVSKYDTRLGRRWNVDPVDQVSISNYAVNANNPIWYIDPNGDKVKAVGEKDQAQILNSLRITLGKNVVQYFNFDKDGYLQYSETEPKLKKIRSPFLLNIIKTAITDPNTLTIKYEDNSYTKRGDGEAVVPKNNGDADAYIGEDTKLMQKGKFISYGTKHGGWTEDPNNSEIEKDQYGQPNRTREMDGWQDIKNNKTTKFWHAIGHFLFDKGTLENSEKANVVENHARDLIGMEKRNEEDDYHKKKKDEINFLKLKLILALVLFMSIEAHSNRMIKDIDIIYDECSPSLGFHQLYLHCDTALYFIGTKLPVINIDSFNLVELVIIRDSAESRINLKKELSVDFTNYYCSIIFNNCCKDSEIKICKSINKNNKLTKDVFFCNSDSISTINLIIGGEYISYSNKYIGY